MFVQFGLVSGMPEQTVQLMQQGECRAFLQFGNGALTSDFVVQTVLLMPQHARCSVLLTAGRNHA